MAEFPNLAGVATKDLVEKIGTGKFSAAYINWSRTLNLLRTHAPGWTANCITADDGGLLHRAPVGAYLMIQFVHTDGTETPAVPQAVMDHRNKAIPFDKIDARDVTDTQRRGTCLAASFIFGLAYELWAKMPMESGYKGTDSQEAPTAPKAGTQTTAAPAQAAAEAVKEFRGSAGATEATFREEALSRGIHTVAIDALVKIVGEKLGGDFGKGLDVLASKSAEELNKKYAPDEKNADGEEW